MMTRVGRIARADAVADLPRQQPARRPPAILSPNHARHAPRAPRRAGRFAGALGRRAYPIRRWRWSSLALRAQRFTPRVSLVPPDGLLLEVKGSLHLFDGVDGLLRALANECASLESGITDWPRTYTAGCAGGGRVGKPFVVTNEAQLVGTTDARCRWPHCVGPQDVVERLARMGVRTIGRRCACRVPVLRAASAPSSSRARSPDGPQRGSAAQFSSRVSVSGAVASSPTSWKATTAFSRVWRRCWRTSASFCEARQCGITELECRLRHRHAPPSSCVLRLAAPLADVAV